MIINFFRSECREITTAMRFGLCDDDNIQPAYINTTNQSIWIATVVNNLERQIEFTAIDNCIEIVRNDGQTEKRCDVMLRYENNLLFVELKTKDKDWQSWGLGQIEATIKQIIQHEPNYYFSFRKRKAIVANSKNKFPGFQKPDPEKREFFYQEYKIRIQYEAEIVIR